MKKIVKVSKLDKPVNEGDKHLKWTVIGPDNEVRNFQTKENATTYAKLRRHYSSKYLAGTAYMNL